MTTTITFLAGIQGGRRTSPARMPREDGQLPFMPWESLSHSPAHDLFEGGATCTPFCKPNFVWAARSDRMEAAGLEAFEAKSEPAFARSASALKTCRRCTAPTFHQKPVTKLTGVPGLVASSPFSPPFGRDFRESLLAREGRNVCSAGLYRRSVCRWRPPLLVRRRPLVIGALLLGGRSVLLLLLPGRPLVVFRVLLGRRGACRRRSLLVRGPLHVGVLLLLGTRVTCRVNRGMMLRLIWIRRCLPNVTCRRPLPEMPFGFRCCKDVRRRRPVNAKSSLCDWCPEWCQWGNPNKASTSLGRRLVHRHGHGHGLRSWERWSVVDRTQRRVLRAERRGRQCRCSRRLGRG